MATRLVYFDETGDDGIENYSCDHFILTSLYMPAESWQDNYNKFKAGRKKLKYEYGMYADQEFHTKEFLYNKKPYCKYNWSDNTRRKILFDYTHLIAQLDAVSINVLIDKTKIKVSDYKVLEKALTYNLQRIDNDSRHGNEWNYIVIADQGRIAVMRKIARKLRVYNPVPSMFTNSFANQPIKYMIEDILDKDSRESFFIQICDFISYFVHMFFLTELQGKPLPTRVARVVSNKSIEWVLETLKEADILNTSASSTNSYGIVVYPK